MSNIQLPRLDEAGNPYISYSQLKLWTDVKGFSTGLPGKQEFIRSYFLGETYADTTGFGTFGSDVEDYITKRVGAEKFNADELKVLDVIKPLDIQQLELKIPFDGFYIKGFVDDLTKNYSIVRDYKTASAKSKEKYSADDYFQLDLYYYGIQKMFGVSPEVLELLIIERLGNGFRGGRAVMTVGSSIWTVVRQVTPERINKLEQFIINTTNEISDYFKVFQKLNQ